MIDTRDFDILSPAFHANPFPTIDRMRAEGSLVHMRLPIVGRTWLALTHDACATLLKDHETFARDPGNAGSKTQARVLRFLPAGERSERPARALFVAAPAPRVAIAPLGGAAPGCRMCEPAYVLIS
jgi:hypothetical protein